MTERTKEAILSRLKDENRLKSMISLVAGKPLQEKSMIYKNSKYLEPIQEKSMTFNELAEDIITTNAANGWDIPHPEWWDNEKEKIASKIALAHGELSEALEAVRADDPINFVEELADTVIRVFELAYGLDMDLYDAMIAKMEVNKGRGYKHGGKAL